jgi:hypothetical protein
VNGDGFDDVVVGDFYAGAFGAAYVFFGKPEGFAPLVSLSELDGKNGFKLSADQGDFAGQSVSSAGDLNGDGYADLIINAANASRAYRHAAFVVFGKGTQFSANVNLSALDGRAGFVLLGKSSDAEGLFRVSGGGDMNGDGFADVAIGAEGANTNGLFSGVVYAFFGGDPGRLRISSDGHSARYTDPDGDLVTVKTTAGVFAKEMFDMRPGGLGFQLEKLDMSNPVFAHANLEFIANRQDANKDGVKDGHGSVDVGYINATGVDLGAVTVAGDLGQIDCGDGDSLKPALKSLTVHSLGAHGTTTQDPASNPNLHSHITGDVKRLTVLNDVTGGVTFAMAGRIGAVTIGGNVEGSIISAHGALLPANRDRRCRHPEPHNRRQCDRLSNPRRL